MFENADGRAMDAGVIGILIAHLGAFGSGELKSCKPNHIYSYGFLFDCTTMGQASDSMTVLT